MEHSIRTKAAASCRTPKSSVGCDFTFGCGSAASWNSWPAKTPRIPRKRHLHAIGLKYNFLSGWIFALCVSLVKIDFRGTGVPPWRTLGSGQQPDHGRDGHATRIRLARE